MGQQQLLLLVLATVIVGLATVAGIQAFEQGSKRANQDALTQTAVKIASDMQANAKKPTQFGGKGVDELSSDNDSEEISFGDMGYETTNTASNYEGSNASSYYKTTDGACGIEAGDVSTTDGFTVRCESADARVVVDVNSLDSEGIETTTQEIKSSSSGS